MTEEIINLRSLIQSGQKLAKIDRLEQERDELLEEIKQLHNGRNSEELYTLFGKPIKYWEELEQENEIIAKQYNSLTKQYNSLMAYTKELEAKINEQQSSNIR